MRKTLLLAIAALGCASPAIAQNDMAPTLGRLDNAAVSIRRTINFTAAGTYADQAQQRLIDVSIDADANGDGENDTGVLRIDCNGGDILSGDFTSGGSSAKANKASGASALSSGKSFKGSWDVRQAASARTTDIPIAVTLGKDAPDVCSGIS